MGLRDLFFRTSVIISETTGNTYEHTFTRLIIDKIASKSDHLLGIDEAKNSKSDFITIEYGKQIL